MSVAEGFRNQGSRVTAHTDRNPWTALRRDA